MDSKYFTELDRDQLRQLPWRERAAQMQSYADALAYLHQPIANSACDLCLKEASPKGFYVLRWSATVRIFWIRIILFSSIFLPFVFVMFLLPIHILPHPDFRMGQAIEFHTFHSLCPSCWREQRIRQAIAFFATLIVGFILAVSFLVTTIAGAVAAVCIGGWWGYKLREAYGAGMVFLVTLVVCVLSKLAINRIPTRILTPPVLRDLAKRPFSLANAEFVKGNNIKVTSHSI